MTKTDSHLAPFWPDVEGTFLVPLRVQSCGAQHNTYIMAVPPQCPISSFKFLHFSFSSPFFFNNAEAHTNAVYL